MANAEKTKKTPQKKSVSKKKVAPKTASSKPKINKTKTTSKKETKIIQEENNYTRTLIAALLIALIFLGGYFAIQFKTNGGLGNNKEYVPTKEEKSFKEDYESLNGTTSVDGVKFSKVEIIEDNNVKYISMDEAQKILDGENKDIESGVIFFGYASCPYSRSAVPVLLKAMESSDLNTIYYVNLRPANSSSLNGVGQKENDLRDMYTLNAKNKAKRTKEAASDSYYKILTSLANHLDDYVLLTNSGKKVKTGEKRLNTPTIVSVIKGEIVGFHQGTAASHLENEKGELQKLTKEEEKELLNEYTKVISAYLTNK